MQLEGASMRLQKILEKTSYRPFPCCSKPLFQSEAECEAIDMKIIFYSHANKTRFHKKSFAFCLVLK